MTDSRKQLLSGGRWTTRLYKIMHTPNVAKKQNKQKKVLFRRLLVIADTLLGFLVVKILATLGSV